MEPHVDSGKIIYRRLEQTGGLQESEKTFTTLDELFAMVLDNDDPFLVDRIVISGDDKDAHHRTLTFIFQSITVKDDTD